MALVEVWTNGHRVFVTYGTYRRAVVLRNLAYRALRESLSGGTVRVCFGGRWVDSLEKSVSFAPLNMVPLHEVA